jgi:hypothetical protein
MEMMLATASIKTENCLIVGNSFATSRSGLLNSAITKEYKQEWMKNDI